METKRGSKLQTLWYETTMCAGIVGNEGSEKEYRPDNGGVVEKKPKKKKIYQDVMQNFSQKVDPFGVFSILYFKAPDLAEF